MTHPDDIRARGVDRPLGPAGPEVSCDECFELLDEYVERELDGGDPAAAIPGMRAHLDGCPACAEHYESLRELVAAGRAAGGA